MRLFPFLALILTVSPVLAGDALARAQAAVARLAELRAQRLAALPADRRELRLTLAHAADRDDSDLVLRQVAGVWQPGQAVVPGWSAATMNDWRSFYHGNSDARKGIEHAVEAKDLRWDASGLHGEAVVTYRYDTTRAEREPAGEVLNFWDRFVASGHTQPRRVMHRIEAEIVPDAWWVELVLEDGVTWPAKPRQATKKPGDSKDGASKDATPPGPEKPAEPSRSPIVVRLRLPSSPTTPVVVKGFNGGWHEADASGLNIANDDISGTLIVYLHQDGWMPWGGGKTWQVAPSGVTYRIQANLKAGIIAGTYDAAGIPGSSTGSSQSFGVETYTNPLGTWKGRILGRAGHLVVGRHATTGDLGERAGAVLGAISIAGDLPAVPVPPTDVQTTAAAGESLLADLRAIALASIHPGLALDRARVQTDLAQHDWTGADAEAIATWLEQAVRWYGQTSTALPTPVAEPAGDSPSLGTLACPGVLPATGWHHLATWKTTALIPARSGQEQDASTFPEVVPAGRPLVQAIDRLGCRRSTPLAIAWREHQAPSLTLMLPDKEQPLHPRYNDALYYAASTFRLDQAGMVRLSVDASDQAVLFLDGRRIWAMPERGWRVRPSGRQVLTLDLTAGEHQVLVRGTHGRLAPWFQLALSREAAQPGLPVGNTTQVVDPAGDPPLAWDLARDTAWRVADLAGSTRPLAVAGLLYVATPGRLHAVDPKDGTQRWQADIGTPPAKGGSELPRPIAWDTELIAGNHRDGTVARLAADGSKRWSASIHLAVGVLHRVGDRLIAEGRPLAAWPLPGGKANDNRLIGVAALDPATGTVTGRWTVRGGPGAGAQGAGILAATGFDDRLTAVIAIPGRTRLHATYLSSAGVLIDVLDGGGTRTLEVDWPGQWDDGPSRADGGVFARATAAVEGSDLILAAQAGISAIGFWIGPDGRLAYSQRWTANGLTSGHGGFPAEAALDAERVYAWQVLSSHGPHCPDTFVECTAYDRTNGRILARQNRLHPGLARGGNSWVQAGRLHIAEPGAEAFVNVASGHVSILAADAGLGLIGGGELAPRSMEPLAVGDRLIVRSPKGLYAIGKHPGQRHAAARLVLDRLGQPVPPSRLTALKALAKIPAGTDLPVTELVSGLAPIRWLGLGPLASIPEDPTPLLPGSGQPWRPLARHEAWRDPATYRRQTELQGTGDIIPHYSAHLDPAACAGPGGSGLFYALLDNAWDRVVVPRLHGPGLTLWVSGHRTVPGEALRLSPGLHQVLIRVDPPWFAQTAVVPVPPVEVAKGLADGSLTSLWPGTWKVAGPISADVPPLDGIQMAKMPAGELSIGQAVVRVHPVPDPDHRLRLTRMVDLPPGASFNPQNQPAEVIIGHPVSAYAFTEITAPADGTLYLTASVDWHMRWFLDGRLIYQTLAAGNGGSTEDLALHPFAAPVQAGKHVLAVELKPGSKGWQLRADIAFSDRPVEALRSIQVPPRLAVPPLDLRLDPAFSEIPLACERMELLRRKLRPLRRVLAAMVKDLPGTPEAVQAQSLLAVPDP